MSEVTFETSRTGTQLAVRSWPAPSPVAAVLIVHGIGEHSGRYSHVAERLNSHGLWAFSYDHRGHGHSHGDRAHVDEWADYVDDAEDRLSAVAVETKLPTVVYGHSMGGLIALDFVLNRPQVKPSALVVTNPALGSNAPGWKKVMARVLAKLFGSVKLPTGIDGEQLSRDPAVGEAYFADPLVTTKASLKWGAEILDAMDRVNRAVDRLDVPTFLGVGAQDTVVPPQSSVALGNNPHVERRLYPKLRHELHNEPEGLQVVDDISAWVLAQVRGG